MVALTVDMEVGMEDTVVTVVGMEGTVGVWECHLVRQTYFHPMISFC